MKNIKNKSKLKIVKSNNQIVKLVKLKNILKKYKNKEIKISNKLIN